MNYPSLMPKPRYKTTNWKQYNKALINRGSLTFWIDEEAIRQWKQSKQDKRGRSDLAITTVLMVISLRVKQVENGIIYSVYDVASGNLQAPIDVTDQVKERSFQIAGWGGSELYRRNTSLNNRQYWQSSAKI